MKAVLMSIQPKWCELIANGKKTVEVRKTKPKLETPFKVYFYCTQGKTDVAWCKGNDILNGKVIGEFVCDEIECFTTDYRANVEQTKRISEQSCVSLFDLEDYECGSNCLFGWHISDLVIYDKPKKLSEFHRECEKPECDDCPHLHFENTPNSYEGWCEFDEKIPIKRPPQSWCYVEECER